MSDSAASANTPKPRLDELMLAMDVVDTLRHQEKTIQKELGLEGRDEALKARLRKIYEGQGLEVNDRILDEGIRALKESRFTYRREGTASGRFWARQWVNRGRTGLIGGGVLAILVLWGGVSFWQSQSAKKTARAQQIELTQTLPNSMNSAKAAALAEAKTAEAKAEAERIAGEGAAALRAKDRAGMQKAIAGLGALKAKLTQEYDLRIVTRKGERSGVFRVPKVNRKARNYYIIVEPVTRDGKIVSIPVKSEEDGTEKTVAKFGVRVPVETFRAIAQDKKDDGIVQRNVLGKKARGSLAPQFLMAASASFILKW